VSRGGVSRTHLIDLYFFLAQPDEAKTMAKPPMFHAAEWQQLEPLLPPFVLPKSSNVTTAGDDKRGATDAFDTLLNAPAQQPPQGIVPGYAHGEKNADEDFAATVPYRKTGVGVAVGQSFERAALRYVLTLDAKYPECPDAENGYVRFRQWCVNAAALAIGNLAQDAPADGFGVHCYNKVWRWRYRSSSIGLTAVPSSNALSRLSIERGATAQRTLRAAFVRGSARGFAVTTFCFRQLTRSIAKRLLRRSPMNERQRLRRMVSEQK
jgi:hypothetical protein